jgi:hypothetical protein
VYSRIKYLPEELSTIILYATSNLATYLYETELKKHFSIDINSVFDCNTVKRTKRAQSVSLAAPITGGKWLINVDADDIQLSDILTLLKNQTYHGVCVFRFSKYSTYMRVRESKVMKELGTRVTNVYLGYLKSEDVYALYKLKYINEGGPALTDDLVEYICNTYNYDIDALFELFDVLKSGIIVENKNDIINIIGIGGASIESVLINAVSVKNNPTDRRIKNWFKTLKVLTNKYEYRTIRNFMSTTLENFRDVKELQLVGNLRSFIEIIPEPFNEEKIKRLKRYYFKLRYVSMYDVIVLRRLINESRKIKDAELGLITSFLKYFSSEV